MSPLAAKQSSSLQASETHGVAESTWLTVLPAMLEVAVRKEGWSGTPTIVSADRGVGEERGAWILLASSGR